MIGHTTPDKQSLLIKIKLTAVMLQ